MRAALEFRDVSYSYGAATAVSGLSFAVVPGEILCLLGPSGCGKTTALRLAAGLEKPDAGAVLVADTVVADDKRFVAPEHRGVGLLFQDYALFPHLSVLRNVTFGLGRLPATQRRQVADQWLARIGLADRAGDYPHMLSGGEQQRVALARAMAPSPAVMLLDEPFSNLDTQLREQIRQQVHDALKDAGTAALMVTHSREEALYMGDRIALMRAGSILQIGDSRTLYQQPASADAAAFFGDINRIERVVAGGSIQTPFGTLAADGFSDGSQVTCCVRAEAIRVVTDTAAGNAQVTAVRHLGRTSRIALKTTGPGVESMPLIAEVQGMSGLQAGATVEVSSDPGLVMVFATDKTFPARA